MSTSPGGVTDILARFLGHHITTKTGGRSLDDRAAPAEPRHERESRAAPDRYTLGFANTDNITIDPYLFRRFISIRSTTSFRSGRSDRAAVPGDRRKLRRGADQIIAYAKANLDKVGYAGAAPGPRPTSSGGELARRCAPEARGRAVSRHRARDAAVIGGDVQATFVRSARISSSCATACCGCSPPPRPSGGLCAERAHLRGARFPGVRRLETFARSPGRARRRGILDKLNRYTHEAQADPETRSASRRPSSTRWYGRRSREFAAQVKVDAVKYERIVREAGIKLDLAARRILLLLPVGLPQPPDYTRTGEKNMVRSCCRARTS